MIHARLCFHMVLIHDWSSAASQDQIYVVLSQQLQKEWQDGPLVNFPDKRPNRPTQLTALHSPDSGTANGVYMATQIAQPD